MAEKNEGETAMKKRHPKRTASIAVSHEKWADWKDRKPQPRFALYDPEHPEETVGAVATRFAEEQGMPGNCTFEMNGRRLDPNQPMGKVAWPKGDGMVALVTIEDD